MADTVLVIGGGPAGLAAARSAAELGASVLLVEAKERLGGTPIHKRYATFTPDLRDAEESMEHLIRSVVTLPEVRVRTATRLTAFENTDDGFLATLTGADGRQEEIAVGSVVVATGFQHFDPGRETQLYGYWEFPDVLTLTDAESALKDGKLVRPSDGQPPKKVALIQCVGSRDRRIGHEYCSKVCCGIASKQAIEIRQHLPETQVFIFYIDLRAFGFWEDELYWRAQEQYHVSFIRGIVTEILPRGNRLVLRGEDTTLGRPVEAEMDMVILSVGMEPGPGTIEIARLLGLPREKHGFLATVGGPLETVATSVEGIFVAGAATGPRDLEDSVSSGSSAGARAVVHLRRRMARA